VPHVAVRWAAIVSGLAWATALSLAGLWLFFALAPVNPDSLGPLLRTTGVIALVAGQLVFLVCVNDRLFPGVHRLVQGGVEMTACGALLVGFIVLLVLLVGPSWA
jgi:hypothetical protein